VIVVSNDKLLEIIPSNTPVERAFAVADDILRQGVVGISEIIVRPGLINVDFADVRSVMGNAGTALMGIGTGTGKVSVDQIGQTRPGRHLITSLHCIALSSLFSLVFLLSSSSHNLLGFCSHSQNRAEDAAAAAISSPLLDSPIDRATGIVFNIIGGRDMTLQEINAAAEVIYDSVDPNANIIFGALVDDSIDDDSVSITVLATGFKLEEVDGIDDGTGNVSSGIFSGRGKGGRGEDDDGDDYDDDDGDRMGGNSRAGTFSDSSGEEIPSFLRGLRRRK